MTDMPMELLPCPFCGDKAKQGKLGGYPYRFFVQCDNLACPCDMPNFESPEAAKASWNSRHHDDKYRALEQNVESMNQTNAALIKKCRDLEEQSKRMRDALALIAAQPFYIDASRLQEIAREALGENNNA